MLNAKDAWIKAAKAARKPVPSPIDDSLGEKIGFESLESLREVLTSMRQRRLDELLPENHVPAVEPTDVAVAEPQPVA